MKKLFILLFIANNCFAQTNNKTLFSTYLKSDSILQQAELLYDTSRYDDAIKLLLKIETPPLGIDTWFSFFLGKCYYFKNNINLADIEFKKAMVKGSGRKAFEYFNQQLNNEYTLNLLSVYDRTIDSIKDKNYMQLEKTIVEMYHRDQDVRKKLHSFYQNNNEDSIQWALKQMRLNDPINVEIYDSLLQKYGWINKTMYIDYFIFPHTIPKHGDLTIYSKYVIQGFNQALKNKADWREVLEFESFFLGKFLYMSGNKIYYPPLINNEHFFSNKEWFLFECDAIKGVIKNILFGGRSKKVKIIITQNTSGEMSKKKCKHLSLKLKNQLIDLGVSEKDFIIKLKHTHSKKTSKNIKVGLKLI